MARLVIDSCVAAKWIVLEEDTELAIDLAESGAHFVAPDFLFVELTNVAWKAERRDPDCAPLDAALANVSRMFETVVDSRNHLVDALAIARQIDHSPYDCLYLAVAQSLDLPLITTDAKLVRKLDGTEHAGRAVRLNDWT